MIILSVQHQALDFPWLRYDIIEDLYVMKYYMKVMSVRR